MKKWPLARYDQFDTPPPPPKVNPKSGNYILRGRKFVPVTGAKLVPGEKLYWYRPRQGQLPGKFISFGTVKSTKPKNPTHV